MRLPIRRSAVAVAPHVAVLAYPGVDELDLFGAYSVLAKAKAAGWLGRLDLAAPVPQVTGSAGVAFETDGIAPYHEDADSLVVPGGRGADEAAQDPALTRLIACAYRRQARIYSCCSGALIVAAALGLASGRLAIHHRKQAELARRFSGTVTAGLVESNGIVSIGGTLSQSVKSVELAYRLLADLDPGFVPLMSERTEIMRSHV